MVSNIKTEEQRERHKAGCKARYQLYKQADVDFHKNEWKKKKDRLLRTGNFDEYREDTKARVRLCYARHRDKYLRPDIAKREFVINHLGGRCVRCGYCVDVRALVLDHKRGDGFEDRKRVGSKIARYYVNHLDEAKNNLQVLCANCNQIKAVESGEHNRSRRIIEEVA